MIPLWIGKMVANRVIKAIKHKIDLKKIDKYVNKPNELDIQIKQQQKTISKQGKYIEEVEKETGLEFKKQHQGMDNFRKYLEENKEIGKYLFQKFRNVLKKS